MEAVAEIEERMQRARRSFDDLKAEMARIIVGHEDLIEQVFIALVCGGHCLLEGVPGLGKTLMVRSLGEILSLSFSRIQFTLISCRPISRAPTCLPTIRPGERSSSSSVVPFSLILFWPTRSIALRPRLNPPCWKPCRSRRNRWREGAPSGESVHGAGHTEPHRDGRNLSASRSPGGSFLLQTFAQYPTRDELARIADFTTAGNRRHCTKSWTQRTSCRCDNGCAMCRSPTL